MVTLTRFACGLAVAASLASGSAIKPRLAHDKVQPFPETVPDDLTGKLYKRFKPWLHIIHGCVPFPAVDAQGNTNDGLDICDGDETNECDGSTGQVYSRSAEKDGMFAIMYTWYFPKDVPSVCAVGGHRHDWENVVLWFSEKSESAKYLGISISAHGGYKKYAQGSDEVKWDGDRALIGYTNEWPLNHHLATTKDKPSGDVPLIAWESLPKAAWDALQAKDWDKADLSFSDKNFDKLLGDSKMDK
ncbi:necrosis inducing protein (NPP1) domain-containing protein [Hirsutella rhossiliensis]|uniref:Necrosis inducing protein (NPP1) domain-containing protein n=1 Tax=Hirsutella rhossiliensis TaxID=111463 RepID=A0A9P8SK77_9HYPO|nr:necrosis inducing protein (NPP1) domain-containing protein [Hirsutella rhossiliensis]KAH0966048.1 necrosis inducing protein (NPP1) domain-containing protein [Hirsutella rhossiliensis]